MWFHISQSHPYLGASPDGAVYDPSNLEQPFARNMSAVEACSLPGFFCTTVRKADGKDSVVLRTSHSYYAQVQGQMAIGERPWCDFVVYTTVGINVQRIHFDVEFWHNSLLPKLIEFYDNCIGPEIVSPIRNLGLPIRNLKKDNEKTIKAALPLQHLHVCMKTTLPTITTSTMTTSNVTTKATSVTLTTLMIPLPASVTSTITTTTIAMTTKTTLTETTTIS